MRQDFAIRSRFIRRRTSLVLLLFVDRRSLDRNHTDTRGNGGRACYGITPGKFERELGRLDDASRIALEGWTMLTLAAAARGRNEFHKQHRLPG